MYIASGAETSRISCPGEVAGTSWSMCNSEIYSSELEESSWCTMAALLPIWVTLRVGEDRFPCLGCLGLFFECPSDFDLSPPFWAVSLASSASLAFLAFFQHSKQFLLVSYFGLNLFLQVSHFFSFNVERGEFD